MKGNFYVLKINDSKLIENKIGNKVFGVRFAKFLPEGWIHLPNTGPNKQLFSDYKNLEKQNLWNELSFSKMYFPRYLQSIKDMNSRKEFLLIKEMLDKGEDVYYACYCKEEKLCHRSIVKQIFKQKGYSVYTIEKELN